MIHVIAVVTAKSGMRDSILAAFHANIPAVKAEDGCLKYGAAIDAEGMGSFQKQWGPDTFLAIEKWRDTQALKAHASAAHMLSYAATVKDMIESRTIHVLSPTT